MLDNEGPTSPQIEGMQTTQILLLSYASDISACLQLSYHLKPWINSNGVQALEAVHALVRQHVAPWDRDRQMSPDIDAVTELICTGQVWNAVQPFLAIA